MYFEGIKISAGAYPFLFLCVAGLAISFAAILINMALLRVNSMERKMRREKERAIRYEERERVREVMAREESSELIMRREELRKPITEWIESSFRKKGKNITSWRFVTGSADELYVGIEGLDKPVRGKLSFQTLGGKIRITRFTYTDENGQTKYMTGKPIPKEKKGQWAKYFQSELTSPEYAAYFNQVAEQCISGLDEGAGTIEITRLFGITDEEFKKTWTKTKVNAFGSALPKEFRILDTKYETGTLKVAFTEEF